MYQGENKTAQFSQRLIADAMLALLETESFAGLSVTEVCRRAQVSRQTFYSLFGTKEQVLAYALQADCCYEPGEREQECRSSCLREFCRGYSRYIVSNRNVLELLVRNDLMHCLYDMQVESLLSCRGFMEGLDRMERRYLVDFIASGMSSIARTYVLTGCSLDAASLDRLMVRLFRGDLLEA